ncbi:hypothetical protein AG1IA_02784 [Rhizoctonia solani AG-1 IA]|uniref:Uncharacterized protein n=1 Tax=Thanatephorus cucumeris (strain AG1-IA) TaxID=983506 RepID=L8X263_THACA|nr:hypothetical protein AG1IA_02784 [Rhizoctonia solani AG-1 IA]
MWVLFGDPGAHVVANSPKCALAVTRDDYTFASQVRYWTLSGFASVHACPRDDTDYSFSHYLRFLIPSLIPPTEKKVIPTFTTRSPRTPPDPSHSRLNDRFPTNRLLASDRACLPR